MIEWNKECSQVITAPKEVVSRREKLQSKNASIYNNVFSYLYLIYLSKRLINNIEKMNKLSLKMIFTFSFYAEKKA